MQSIAAVGGRRIDRLVIDQTPISTLSAGTFANLNVVSLVFSRNGLRNIEDGAFGGQMLDSLKELALAPSVDGTPF